MKTPNGNPFRTAFTIDLDTLFETAIRRANQASPPKTKNLLVSYKLRILNRIEILRNILTSRLRLYIQRFPRIEHLHNFYRSVLEIYDTADNIKKMLGRVNGVIKVINMLADKYKRYVRSTIESTYVPRNKVMRSIEDLWKQYIARVHSAIKKIRSTTANLNKIIITMKKLPDYNPKFPALIVCGPPNSGKSTLVGALTNANVQIASYPYTTKNLVFGHIILDPVGKLVVQIVDSPGLFDRPIEGRKKEELLALYAIKNMANGIIFLFDCSIEATLDPPSQIKVFEDVLSFLSSDIAIVAINKIDIADNSYLSTIREYLRKKETEYLEISAKKNIGIDTILENIKKYFEGTKNGKHIPVE